MMISKGIFLSLGQEVELEEWTKRIVKYLRKKSKASFQDIVKELELEGGAKEILSGVLGIMQSEGIISSEPKSIAVDGGLILTRMYKLPEGASK